MQSNNHQNISEEQLLLALKDDFRSLKFPEPLEGLYLAESSEEGLKRGRIAAITGMVLFSLFALKDVLILPPEIAIWTASIRMALICPALFFLYVVLNPSNTKIDPTIPTCGVLLICGHGLALCLLIAQAGGIDVHYAGMFLVTIGGYFLTGLRFAPAALANLSFCISYLFGLAVLNGPEVPLTAYYLFTGNCIGMIGAWSLEYNTRRYFIMRSLAEVRSERDALTGLLNRGAIQTRLNELWTLSRNNGDSMAVIMADADYFKLYNDEYGHLVGDECLKTIAHCLEQQVHRPFDAVGRFGGEEFIFVLFDVDAGFVQRFCENTLEAIKDLAIPHDKSNVDDMVTISLGAAIANGYDEQSYEKLIAQADAALYKAKSQGRNRHVTNVGQISLAS